MSVLLEAVFNRIDFQLKIAFHCGNQSFDTSNLSVKLGIIVAPKGHGKPPPSGSAPVSCLWLVVSAIRMRKLLTAQAKQLLVEPSKFCGDELFAQLIVTGLFSAIAREGTSVRHNYVAQDANANILPPISLEYSKRVLGRVEVNRVQPVEIVLLFVRPLHELLLSESVSLSQSTISKFGAIL